MGVPGVNLVFRPPDWPVLLSVVAAVLLAWELASLLRVIWRGRGGAEAGAITLAALLAGAVVGPIAALYGAMSVHAEGAVGTGFKPVPPGRALARACLRGSIIVAAGLAILFWPRLGSLAAIAACMIAWSVRSYSRTTSPVSRRLKSWLLVLRIAVLVLLAVWTARPVLERYREIRTRRKLLIGIDVSKSMQRRDVSPGGDGDAGRGRELITRIDAVNRTLRDRRGILTDLLDQADVAFFTFSGRASAQVEFTDGDEVDFLAPPAGGDVTALGDSAQAAFEQCLAAREEVAAVVLITDGCSNTSDVISPDRWAKLMGSRGVPIFTVGAGSQEVTGSTRTLTVRELTARDEVNAFNRLPVTAVVEAIGLQGRRVKITCLFDDKLVGQEVIDVANRRESQTVRFVHVPLTPGYHRLLVTARCVGDAPPGLAGEPRAGKLIHVVDRDVRILYVEGKFRFESKFIKQAMEGAKRFGVNRYILLQPLRRDRPGPLGEELDDWLSYHAIIFGDVSASRFSRKQLEIIKELVGKYGKGFCMIGGRNSFGGGWADTPIADIMPIDLKRSAGQTDRMLRITPTAEGRESDLMRIGVGDDVSAAWAKLDRLPGANVLGGVKPAATVLAAGQGDLPMIVSQPYGKGRTLAIAFDTTWRWVLSPKDTAEMQKRFWRQVGMHLAAPKGNVWVVTDKTSYDQRRLLAGGETIEITAGVEDSSGRPMRDARVTVKLTRPDGSVSTVAREAADAVRRWKLPLLRKPGVYRLRIEAEVEGKTLSAEHRFEVVRRDAEALDVLANFDLLRRIAGASGGRFYRLGDFSRIAVQLRPATRQKVRTEPASEDLAEEYSWPVILAILTLLCLEWAVRKRKGLV